MRRVVAVLIVFVFLTSSSLLVIKAVFSAADAVENSWTAKASIPQAEGVMAAAVNGKIYAIGGSINYMYDPATNNWTAKTPMPTSRGPFGIVAYQNKLYAIGGYIGWTQETGTLYSNANEVYDPATDTWETKKPMPTNRSTPNINVVNGKIHLITTDAHDVYDIATDIWTARTAMPLSDPAYIGKSTVVDDKIYVLGGNQTQIYDTESDAWSFGAASPIKVSDPGVCATTGVMAPKRIYVFGGATGFLNYTNVTQVYDPKTDTWTFGASMLTPRAGLMTAVVNDLVYAIGGERYWGRTETVNEQYTPFGYGVPDSTFDGVAPEISLVSPRNETYYDSNVLLQFSANEPLSNMYCRLDGVTFEVPGNSTLDGLSSGSHSLTFFAIDRFGNMQSSEVLYFFVAAPNLFSTMLLAIASLVIVAVISGLLVYFKKRKPKAGTV